MYPHTGARADRFSATLAHLMFAAAAALALLGLAALLNITTLPVWAWLFIAPDTLAVTVGGFLLALAARGTTRGAYR
ncbi:MAG TPA: hypothetical protein VGS97_05210 [Actinocrinis sp.]|uniref:hypothetical protein n=1 Tax=Actinocrinis sp. TaxID=1920516 RepID=UPI002DDDB738|nr:hypothetical protein [Actinocrinis sp.]HEV2343472.1 hypothetical protein [Actinocrinis sp.]